MRFMPPTKTEPSNMTALPLRTRALSPSAAGLFVGGSVTVVATALPETSIPEGQFRQPRRLRPLSVQINPYDGQNGISVVTSEVVERLLLNAEGNAQRISDRNFTDPIVQRLLKAL